MTPDFNYGSFYQQLEDWAGSDFAQIIKARNEGAMSNPRHGDFNKKWRKCLENIQVRAASDVSIAEGAVSIGGGAWATPEQLMGLHPWRKGPLRFGDVHVDCEWRSDFKWNRLEAHLPSLAYHRVLDIGCGNGYFLWRLKQAGAKFCVGIDPNMLFLSQFWLFRRCLPQDYPVWLLPLGIQDWPQEAPAFDTVLSMGVLYHRKSPLRHLERLLQCTVPGGNIVLETLVVDGDEQTCLMPKDRYAQMRNVWFLPSSSALKLWCERVGMKNVRVVDESLTTTEEQRSTPWMTFNSLPDFLDPNDSSKSIEGHPAPKRAILIANA